MSKDGNVLRWVECGIGAPYTSNGPYSVRSDFGYGYLAYVDGMIPALGRYRTQDEARAACEAHARKQREGRE